jgi:hypothetical protein
MNDPVPSDFGWRYVLWTIWSGWVYLWRWVWSQAITILMIVQATFTAITLDPTLVSHDATHWILLGNAVLCAILAQIKRTHPADAKLSDTKEGDK